MPNENRGNFEWYIIGKLENIIPSVTQILHIKLWPMFYFIATSIELFSSLSVSVSVVLLLLTITLLSLSSWWSNTNGTLPFHSSYNRIISVFLADILMSIFYLGDFSMILNSLLLIFQSLFQMIELYLSFLSN